MITVGNVEMFSEAMCQVTTYTILLPDNAKHRRDNYPVLMLLHGRAGGYHSWLYQSKLLSALEDLPIIAVLPDGADFMWSNMYPTIPLEDFLIKELRENVSANFHVQPDLPWAVEGYSMGGYGAIRLGLKYPDKFCSIYAHSSPIHTREQMASWPNNFTPEIITDLDCEYWAMQLDRAKMPRLSFDCGSEDEAAIADNRRFHHYLQEIGLPHQYNEYPGEHNWEYWNARLPIALQQHAEVFGC